MTSATQQSKAKQLLRWLFLWLPPLVVMGLIYHLSAQPTLPQAPGPLLDAVLKKLSHAAVYLLLFLLLVRAWNGGTLAPRGIGPAVAVTLVYALSDEWHQGHVPGRHASWYDVVIDVAIPVAVWLRRRLGVFGAQHRARDDDLAE